MHGQLISNENKDSPSVQVWKKARVLDVSERQNIQISLINFTMQYTMTFNLDE